MTETERTMLDRLNRRYGSFNGNGFRYSRAEHVRAGLGFDARRICDYMAMDLYGEGTLHGHEVKVSRSDWLTELKDPSKALEFSVYCDFWWLVVSDKSIVKPGELPPGWGLMVASGDSVRISQQAEKQVALALPRSMQGTFSRAVTKTTIRLDRDQDKALAWVAYRMGLPSDPRVR